MIKSMTGFASLTRDDERGAIGVTIRSVNHRFLDLQLRLPPVIADLEPRLRALVQKQLARGRVEISVSLQLRQNAAPQIELNEEFVQALSGAMAEARRRGVIAGELTPGDLLRLPQALTIRERQASSDDELMNEVMRSALAGAPERRLERRGKFLVQVHVDAGHVAQLQRNTQLDPAARHPRRHQRPDVALDRRHRLRHAELQIEMAVIQRADRDADGRAVVLGRRRSKAGHALDHDGTMRRSAFRVSSSCI